MKVVKSINWEETALRFTDEAANKRDGLTVSLHVQIDACITLGFDPGRKITGDDLWKSVTENVESVLKVASANDNHVTKLRVLDVRDE